MQKKLTPYEKVLVARKQTRPGIEQYIHNLFDDFMELKGDRLFGDDPSIVGGIAMFRGKPVTVIGQRKGKNTEENVKYNFGMTSPEGYRKAVRLMEQAEKFKRPILTFVDTPGAYPGMEAEARGQSNAIAESIAKMLTVKVPTITLVTGEGCSGGALALAAGDRVYMMEHAVYSILSPEGFASIMWKDAKLVEKASEVMKMTAEELYEYGLIDGIIKENSRSYGSIRAMLSKELQSLSKLSESALLQERYKKYRDIGVSNS